MKKREKKVEQQDNSYQCSGLSWPALAIWSSSEDSLTSYLGFCEAGKSDDLQACLDGSGATLIDTARDQLHGSTAPLRPQPGSNTSIITSLKQPPRSHWGCAGKQMHRRQPRIRALTWWLVTAGNTILQLESRLVLTKPTAESSNWIRRDTCIWKQCRNERKNWKRKDSKERSGFIVLILSDVATLSMPHVLKEINLSYVC